MRSSGVTEGASACSPLLRGDGPETIDEYLERHKEESLAVPSYGAMALKQYHHHAGVRRQGSCSPLLRGDGPETRGCCGVRSLPLACSPLLRGDGPETTRTSRSARSCLHLQSPPTGRW